MHLKIAALLLAGMLISIPAQCQLVEKYQPPQANCCLAMTARSLADQMLDWNQLGRYHAENQELKKQPQRRRVQNNGPDCGGGDPKSAPMMASRL